MCATMVSQSTSMINFFKNQLSSHHHFYYSSHFNCHHNCIVYLLLEEKIWVKIICIYLNRIYSNFCVKSTMSKWWCKYLKNGFYKKCLTHHVCQSMRLVIAFTIFIWIQFRFSSWCWKYSNCFLKNLNWSFFPFLFNLKVHKINGVYRFNKGIRSFFYCFHQVLMGNNFFY